MPCATEGCPRPTFCRSLCKPCYERDWRNKNPEYNRQKCSRWAKQNAEKKAEGSRAWVERNRTSVQAYARNWRQENRDKTRANGRSWSAANPEKVKVSSAQSAKKHAETKRAGQHARRARKVNSGGSYTAAQWRELKTAHGNMCARCGRDDVGLEADHIIALARGGSSDIANIQPLCANCNRKKFTRSVAYARGSVVFELWL